MVLPPVGRASDRALSAGGVGLHPMVAYRTPHLDLPPDVATGTNPASMQAVELSLPKRLSMKFCHSLNCNRV
jgi:hypothetical protein